MVLDETLRLHPPALPVTAKQAVQNDILPNGALVKAGQTIFISPYVTQRMTEYWGDDANEFRPDRWENLVLSGVDKYKFLPFQRGPRICLGMNMAYEEAKTVVSVILKSNYRMRLTPGQNITYKTGFPIILNAKNGIKMTVETASS